MKHVLCTSASVWLLVVSAFSALVPCILGLLSLSAAIQGRNWSIAVLVLSMCGRENSSRLVNRHNSHSHQW